MLLRNKAPLLITDRLELRLPKQSDFAEWHELRKSSRTFLEKWEPTWADDHLSRNAFVNRLNWAQRAVANKSAAPFFLIREADEVMVGGITLDHVRYGASQSGNLGYWIGQQYARRGYMREAILAVVHYAFTELDLSRIEAACLPNNLPSRGLLEKTGFKYEGVAQSYLEIAGRWSNHVLYANLRSDRRGRTDPY